jgi:hypothetical protein
MAFREAAVGRNYSPGNNEACIVSALSPQVTLVRFSNYLKLESEASGSCPDHFLPY